MNQESLFSEDLNSSLAQEAQGSQSSLLSPPLAYRMRPKNFDQYFGQEHLFKRYKFLKDSSIPIPSLIIWGPPGTGKTTLAHILATTHQKEFYTFNAVLGGVVDLKKLIAKAIDVKKLLNKDPLIFIDEIHRFNKAQQDALLPYVEDGSFTLIGATTQPPQVSINRALLSRLQIIELQKLSDKNLAQILKAATEKLQVKIDHEIIEKISNHVGGDARIACNYLEQAINQKISNAEDLVKLINLNNNLYDKDGSRHYDVISAFIKSMRGSDPNSALLWMAIMLDAGEDPIFIARRMIVFASEDIGNADPSALTIAVSTLQAIKNIGMPEARINLAQACTHLASTVKSNASYKALDRALEFVKNNPLIEVPTHLRNNHPNKKSYKYPHNYPNNFVNQNYGTIEKFYHPSEHGFEKKLKDRLKSLWNS